MEKSLSAFLSETGIDMKDARRTCGALKEKWCMSFKRSGFFFFFGLFFVGAIRFPSNGVRTLQFH